MSSSKRAWASGVTEGSSRKPMVFIATPFLPISCRLVRAEIDKWCPVAVDEIQVLGGKAVHGGPHDDGDGVAHELLSAGRGDGRRVQRAGGRRRRTDGLAAPGVRGAELGPPRAGSSVELAA